jgi:hypothetical protein
MARPPSDLDDYLDWQERLEVVQVASRGRFGICRVHQEFLSGVLFRPRSESASHGLSQPRLGLHWRTVEAGSKKLSGDVLNVAHIELAVLGLGRKKPSFQDQGLYQTKCAP